MSVGISVSLKLNKEEKKNVRTILSRSSLSKNYWRLCFLLSGSLYDVNKYLNMCSCSFYIFIINGWVLKLIIITRINEMVCYFRIVHAIVWGWRFINNNNSNNNCNTLKTQKNYRNICVFSSRCHFIYACYAILE